MIMIKAKRATGVAEIHTAQGHVWASQIWPTNNSASQELMEPWKLNVYKAGKWGHEQPNHREAPAPGIWFLTMREG